MGSLVMFTESVPPGERVVTRQCAAVGRPGPKPASEEKLCAGFDVSCCRGAPLPLKVSVSPLTPVSTPLLAETARAGRVGVGIVHPKWPGEVQHLGA